MVEVVMVNRVEAWDLFWIWLGAVVVSAYRVCRINNEELIVETNNQFIVEAKDVALVIVIPVKRERVVPRIKLFRKNVVPIAENVGMEVWVSQPLRCHIAIILIGKQMELIDQGEEHVVRQQNVLFV
jgi:hypothetical protein